MNQFRLDAEHRRVQAYEALQQQARELQNRAAALSALDRPQRLGLAMLESKLKTTEHELERIQDSEDLVWSESLRHLDRSIHALENAVELVATQLAVSQEEH